MQRRVRGTLPWQRCNPCGAPESPAPAVGAGHPPPRSPLPNPPRQEGVNPSAPEHWGAKGKAPPKGPGRRSVSLARGPWMWLWPRGVVAGPAGHHQTLSPSCLHPSCSPRHPPGLASPCLPAAGCLSAPCGAPAQGTPAPPLRHLPHRGWILPQGHRGLSRCSHPESLERGGPWAPSPAPYGDSFGLDRIQPPETLPGGRGQLEPAPGLAWVRAEKAGPTGGQLG